MVILLTGTVGVTAFKNDKSTDIPKISRNFSFKISYDKYRHGSECLHKKRFLRKVIIFIPTG